MNNDEKFLKKIKNPKDEHRKKEEEYHIVEMVKMSYTQVVHIMMNIGADINIKSKLKVTYKKEDT